VLIPDLPKLMAPGEFDPGYLYFDTAADPPTP
jgi:hypothetical protein